MEENTNSGSIHGKVMVVSTGPGGSRQMTPDAAQALGDSDVVVGYDKYVDEISELIESKEKYVSGMTQEIQRINRALDFALDGKNVALVSNGDAGVYGMASLIFEMADERKIASEIEIEVFPGVTALMTAAARAGAPLSQDFAVISLSDRLTPIETIEKRLRLALEADFVIGIYNPISKSRVRPFEIFVTLVNEYRADDCPVVLARDLDRPDEKVSISNVSRLKDGDLDFDINMSTILLVGNSSSRFTSGGRVLTPRGYLKKYDTEGKKRKEQS